MRRRDSLLPINHLGKRRTETAKTPIEFDLSFTCPETAPFRSRGQKSRDHSLGINLYSRSSEYRPAPCRLETRGVNDEIAGEREQNGKEKASVSARGWRLDNRIYSPMSLVALPWLSYETKLSGTVRYSKSQVRTLSVYSHSFTLVCRGVIPAGSSLVVGFDRLAAESLRVS